MTEPTDPTAAPIPTLSPSQRVPAETALRRLEAAVVAARHAGNGNGLILARVANGLTGEINGPRERVIARRLYVALLPLLDLDLDTIKALDKADIDRAQGRL